MNQIIKVAGLVVLLAGLAALPGCKQEEAPAGLRARIQEATGTVRINEQPARVGDVIQHGDLIETAADSTVHLLLENRGGLTLRGGTRLKLDIADEKVSLGLEQGDLIAAFHRIQANQNVSVVTPTVIAGVRGTHFFVKVHHGDHVYVCTCNGRVHYQGHGHEEGEVVEAHHHRAYHFKRSDGAVQRDEGAMEHHEDAELERTADLIGKSIDWTKVP